MEAFGNRSWEGWQPVNESAGVDVASDSDEEPMPVDYNNLSVLDASGMLEDLLVSLKLSGNINATHCCTLAFFASKAGCPGELLKQLALKPSANSGKFSQRFDSAVGCSPRDANLYETGMGM
jgi:hypothetical protein